MSQQVKASEKALCAWFASWLGHQHRPPMDPEDVDEPDVLDRQKPAVDLAFTLGGRRYALEHTRVDAFPGRRHEDVKFAEAIYRPLHGLELGDYLLVCHGDASEYKRAAENGNLAARTLKQWIRDVGPALGEHEDRIETLDAVGFEVSLSRKEFWLQGRLAVGRRARGHDQQVSLATSVAHTLKKKLPKLGDARRRADCSILLLETDDISTTGPGNLVPAFAEGIRSAAEAAPDLVYLVETSLGTKFIAAIKHGPTIFSDASATGWEGAFDRCPPLPLD